VPTKYRDFKNGGRWEKMQKCFEPRQLSDHETYASMTLGEQAKLVQRRRISRFSAFQLFLDRGFYICT
jgi:hypothetical protein